MLDSCALGTYTCAGTSGLILSPNYPWSLKTGPVFCRWEIRAPPRSYVVLRFTNVSFDEPQVPCQERNIKVYDQESADTYPLMEQYCSSNLHPAGPIESNLNVVLVHLKSFTSPTGVTMMLEYEAAYFEEPSIDAPEDGTAKTGVLNLTPVGVNRGPHPPVLHITPY